MATTAMGVPFLAKKIGNFILTRKIGPIREKFAFLLTSLFTGELSKFLQQSIQKGRQSRKLTTKIIQILLYFPNKGRI